MKTASPTQPCASQRAILSTLVRKDGLTPSELAKLLRQEDVLPRSTVLTRLYKRMKWNIFYTSLKLYKLETAKLVQVKPETSEDRYFLTAQGLTALQ